jgi:hypothetical protein
MHTNRGWYIRNKNPKSTFHLSFQSQISFCHLRIHALLSHKFKIFDNVIRLSHGSSLQPRTPSNLVTRSMRPNDVHCGNTSLKPRSHLAAISPSDFWWMMMWSSVRNSRLICLVLAYVILTKNLLFMPSYLEPHLSHPHHLFLHCVPRIHQNLPCTEQCPSCHRSQPVLNNINENEGTIPFCQAVEDHTGRETSWFPHLLDNRPTVGSEVVRLKRRPDFASHSDSWNSFLLEDNRKTKVPLEEFGQFINNYFIRNKDREFPASNVVPQPTPQQFCFVSKSIT